jgi:PKD repeat protein
MRNFTKLKNDWSKKIGLLAGVALFATTQIDAQTYCTTSNTSTTTYYIASVTTTGGTTNISNAGTTFSSGGYADYSATQIVTVLPGASFTLAAAGQSSSYTYVWAVYCDWNQDGDFNDAGETVYTAGSYVWNISTSITVPASTPLGNVRMRVVDAYFSPIPTACGNNTSGEAEDYTIRVLPLNNVAIRGLDSMPSTPFCSLVSYPIAVTVYNHGSNAINSANINWSLNGVLQTPVTLSAPLVNTFDSTTVVLTNMYFADTTQTALKVWTSLPNGVNDTYHADDTLATTIGAKLLGVNAHIKPGDTTICSGSTISLDAGAFPKSPIYIWNNGQITESINVSQPGLYSVTVQNTDGCFGTDTVNITVHPDPLVNSIAIIDNDGGSFTFNVIGAQNITSYSWDFGDTTGTTDGVGSPSQVIHQYTYPANYTVTLTLRNDCGEITVTKLIQTGGMPTGIDNVTALQKQLSIFPNPAKSMVTVANTNKIKMNAIRVYNLMGQMVMENTSVNADKYEFNIAGLAEGTYNIIIDTEAGKATKKLDVIR